MSQVVVVIGGGGLFARARAAVDPDALVIAADSGLDHAVASGLHPSLLVGDLDSVSAGGRMWAYAHDVEIDQHPADKDVTDTGLALAAAAATGATDLLLIGGDGDRLDHTLGALVALGAPDLARFGTVAAHLGATRVHVLHPGHAVTLTDERPGTTFSLLALHGACTGVAVSGARWPLADATLAPAATIGISNETSVQTSHPTRISVVGGVLTVVIP